MRKPAYSARDREDAYFKAEQKLTTKGRPSTEPALISWPPEKIKTIPELFQPREFTYGFRDLDRDHVKKLKRSLEDSGELDPILVIKLKGVGFVCVDGHHRLEAYIKAGKPEIVCEWFGGTVRQAADESMRRNKKDRLNVPQQDKFEEAWKRVVLGWGSIKDTAEICGVSKRTVSKMREILKAATAKDAAGKLFQERLRAEGIREVGEKSWTVVRMVYAGVPGRMITEESQAAQLAKRLGARMTNLLKRDPKITARAIQLYDPELPVALTEAWEEMENDPASKQVKVIEDR